MIFTNMVLAKHFLFTIIFLLFALLWSSKIFFLAESDFWQYVVGAYFFEKPDKLYISHWDNKGPFFYQYIKIILSIFGKDFTAIYSLILFSLIIYSLPLIYIFKKFEKNLMVQIAFLFIFLALLFSQSYYSIPFLLSSTLKFFFLVFAYKCFLEKQNLIRNFSLCLLTFWLSFFTLVDTILYFPILLIVMFKFFYFKRKFELLNYLLLFFIIPISLYIILQFNFHYDFKSFIDSNFSFNSWATENYYGVYFTSFKINFNKIELFENLLRSGILILFLVFLADRVKNFKQYFKFLFTSKFPKLLNKFLFVDLLLLILIILFLILRVDKSVYVFLFFPTILFLIANFSEELKNKSHNKILITVILIAGFTTFIETGKNLNKVNKNKNCISFEFCKKSEYQKFNIIKENYTKGEEIIIVGKGTGYLNYYYNLKPKYSIINEWIYFDKNYINDAFLNFHNHLLKKNKGFKFWIDEEIINLYGINRNFYLDQILNNSVLLVKDKYYSMYEIK